jgi:Ser/Thr protein kinase RdoA (MazF antagonist)
MRFPADSAAAAVIETYGVQPSALLGSGGEALVYALDEERVLRVHRPGPTAATIVRRASLLAELAANDPALPFAIPEVLEQAQVHERWVTIERRLPGRPLSELLGEIDGAARDTLVLSYLEAGQRLAKVPLQRAFYGDLLADDALRTASFRQYLEQRARLSLAAGGEPLAQIDAAPLAGALPEATEPAFVYLDYYPSNVLVAAGRVTAVVDFGGAAIVGERRFATVVGATGLPPRDAPLALAWLRSQGLSELYAPTRNWMAAFWSFARDDAPLFAWCRSVLLG